MKTKYEGRSKNRGKTRFFISADKINLVHEEPNEVFKENKWGRKRCVHGRCLDGSIELMASKREVPVTVGEG